MIWVHQNFHPLLNFFPSGWPIFNLLQLHPLYHFTRVHLLVPTSSSSSIVEIEGTSLDLFFYALCKFSKLLNHFAQHDIWNQNTNEERDMIKTNLDQIPNMSPSFHSKVLNKKGNNHMSFITTYSIPKDNKWQFDPKIEWKFGGKTFLSGITNKAMYPNLCT